MGTLYSNGISIGEGTITTHTITPDENLKTNGPIRKIVRDRESTTTCRVRQPVRNQVLSFIYGKPITNNYLKMHGGIMSRKVTGTRKSKNMK